MYSESQRHLTYKEPQILGKLTVKSKDVLVELVAGHGVLEFFKQLEEDQSLNLILNYLHEKHECESKKIGGPTAALAALVAVAIAAITAGTGAGALLAAGLQLGSGAVAVGACGAAISSIGTQVAVGLLSHKGDVGRALGTLTDKKFVKSFAISVVSAGATAGLCDKLDIKTPNAATLKGADLSTKFATHFKYNLVRAAVDTGLKTTFEGGKVHKTLENNLKNAVISSVSATVANQIGDWYGTGELNFASHKALHGALGAGLGALKGDPVAGALASVVAETLAELTFEDMDSLTKRVHQKALEKGIQPDSEEFYGSVYDEIKGTLNGAKFGAALTTFLAGRDVNVGYTAADNAVENNSVMTIIMRLLMAAGVGMTAKDGYDAYQEEGMEAAAETVATDIAIGAATGGALKVGGKAVKGIYNGVKGAAKIGKTKVNIKWGKGIQDQGMPWEDYIAQTLPAEARLPKNFKTFDFFDGKTGTAISAKTLNTQTASRLKDPGKIYQSAKKNIDSAADFKNYVLSKKELTSQVIEHRVVKIAIPDATSSAQLQELYRAVEYGKMRNIIVEIIKVK